MSFVILGSRARTQPAPGAAGSFNPFANKGARFTIAETPGTYGYDFDSVIPLSTTPNADDPIPDGSGWTQIFNPEDGTSGIPVMRRVVDATVPFGSTYCLECKYVAGTGSPSSSSGAGSLFRRSTAATTGYYTQFTMWHDAAFPWNAVSNKLYGQWNTAESGEQIMESVHFANDPLAWQFEGVSGVPYYPVNQTFGLTLTKSMFEGVWWNLEVEYLFGTTTGSLKVWAARCNGADGNAGLPVLVQTNINVPVGRQQHINTTWGGASGPIPRDGYRRHGNIYIARD